MNKPTARLNQGSLVIWFTGLSGSGKTTLANHLAEELKQLQCLTYVLDGDKLRKGLNKDLGFTLQDRTENIRRVAEVANMMKEVGVVVLVAAISPLTHDRQMAKQIIGENQFLEIYVNTPLEVCERRDVKGLYQKARAGHMPHFTGLTSPYEAPQQPWLEINTNTQTIEQSVSSILSKLRVHPFR